MKKTFLTLIILLMVVASCKEEVIKKPNKLVEKEVMINILYDLSVLEALRSQTTGNLYSYPKPMEFVKKKYKIDSLTFVQNTQYYAADIKEYRKMYNKILEKIDKESSKSPSVPKPKLPPNTKEIGTEKY